MMKMAEARVMVRRRNLLENMVFLVVGGRYLMLGGGERACVEVGGGNGVGADEVMVGVL